MLSTVVLTCVVLLLLFLSVVLWGGLLWVGLRWARVEVSSLWRVCAATVIVFVAMALARILIDAATPQVEFRRLVLVAANLIAAVVVPCVVIVEIFRVKPLKAFQAWLPTMLSNLLMFFIPFLIIRPYVIEAFQMPTNAMAPTVLGKHWAGVCPDCGKSACCSVRDSFPVDGVTTICENFHVHQLESINERIYGGDRILCNKIVTPERWDMVILLKPDDPRYSFLFRLIGLPGETVVVKDGAVWIDGKPMTPPDDLKGIRYESPRFMEEYAPEFWGSPEKPAALGEDEFFVLGDFSLNSNDSRFWETGAPGHPPYAVPASYIKGVVTHTYWPLTRCRVHR